MGSRPANILGSRPNEAASLASIPANDDGEADVETLDCNVEKVVETGAGVLDLAGVSFEVLGLDSDGELRDG